MGNAGSAQGGAVIRDRHKSGEVIPSSPSKEGQAFTFDKVPRSDNKSIVHQGSQEDEPPAIFTTPNRDIHLENADRPRANTIDTTQTNSYKTPTVFRWEGGGKEVFVSGSFSEWKTIPMVKSHGNFVTIVDLPEGEHQYKFYVDGEWRNDPGNQVVENTVGTKNNQISVRKSDFEVFQALDKDSESCPHDVQREYSQEIPSNKPWEKQNGPPILPPHLLQVILNKDTPLSCEPTLLPEPNHVMLNHLYALSIKDGVMVLSATHRYRKKYVTTLLYKPITT